MTNNFWAIVWMTLAYIAFGLLAVWMTIEATGGF